MVGIKHSTTKTSGERGYADEWNADHVINGNVDFNQYQALQLVAENRTDFPAGPVEGQIIYRSDQHTFYHWNGTVWVAIQGPATVVVAADGSGMTTDIQEGIDMLPVGGGVVYIKEGTYTVTSSITIDKDNVAIMGAGKSTKIVTGLDIAIFHPVSHDFLLFSDFWIYGSGNGKTGNYGIYLQSCDHCSIKGVYFENCGAACIYLYSSHYALVSENFFSNNWDIGLDAEGCWIPIFSDNIMDTIVSHGVYFHAGTGWGTIADNNFYYVDGHNIWLENHADLTIVIGNSIGRLLFGTEPVRDGIRVENLTGSCVITNNTVEGKKGYGINIVDNTCDKNMIMNNIVLTNLLGQINDAGTNTQPNGVRGTHALALDDLNIIT